MDLNVYYYDKKIAEVNKHFLSLLEISEDKLSQLKTLISKEYSLSLKREESLKKSGFVPVELITALNQTKDGLLEFWKMRKEKGLCSLKVYEYIRD